MEILMDVENRNLPSDFENYNGPIYKEIEVSSRDINKPLIIEAIKKIFPLFDNNEVDSHYALYFAGNCVTQVALTALRKLYEK